MHVAKHYKWLLTAGIMRHRDVVYFAATYGFIDILEQLREYDEDIFVSNRRNNRKYASVIECSEYYNWKHHNTNSDLCSHRTRVYIDYSDCIVFGQAKCFDHIVCTEYSNIETFEWFNNQYYKNIIDIKYHFQKYVVIYYIWNKPCATQVFRINKQPNI